MEPALAAIGHTTVHAFLKKVVKELDNHLFDHVAVTANGVQGWLKGTLTNNSIQTMHGLRITGTWYGSGNNSIGMSSGYVDGLGLNPGKNGTFSQFANYDESTTPSTVELSYDCQ